MDDAAGVEPVTSSGARATRAPAGRLFVVRVRVFLWGVVFVSWLEAGAFAALHAPFAFLLCVVLGAVAAYFTTREPRDVVPDVRRAVQFLKKTWGEGA